MNIARLTERVMAMGDTTWQRHASPWSGWSRLTILPLLTAALWSRVWIGWWAIVPIAAVILWTWWNPRAFAPPATIDNWMSRGVLGERMWLNQNNHAIPRHHARFATILGVISAAGLIPYIWGVVQLTLWPTLLGLTITIGAKLWFLDRMVRIYRDMHHDHP